jgi:predicted nucleic acid-binding protein
MTRHVVDASVGVKWVLDEVHAEQASKLLSGNYALLVPDLFFAEVGNIIWKKVRRGEMQSEEAWAVPPAIASVRLRSFPCQPLLSLALEIAVQADRTVYDSLYVALAVMENIQCVTADERLYNSLHSGSLAPHVVWIEDLST